MRIYVAIPAHDGRIHTSTMSSLYAGKERLTNAGHEVKIGIVSNSSLVVAARNHLVDGFLKWGGDKLFFLDTDIFFMAESMENIVLADGDIVGSAYAQKTLDWKKVLKAHEEGREHPVAWGSPINIRTMPETRTKGPLCEVEGLPTGFMSIRREVFERMMELAPSKGVPPMCLFGEKTMAPNIFRTGIVDGQFWGEDILFCREAREAGFSVWLHTEVRVGHIGQMVYHVDYRSLQK